MCGKRWFLTSSLLLTSVAGLFAAPAGDALQTINNPGGGVILYGPLSPQSSARTAFGEMLRQIHAHYGDRPQIGKLFRDKSGESVAAFFNLTAKNSSGAGGQQIAGLVIVSVPKSGSPRAAVLTDDAKRFPATLNPMLQRLQAATAPQQSRNQALAAPVSTSPLTQTRFPDGSGSVGLPAGWQLVNAHAGDVFATGPQGEWLRLGMRIPVIDPTNPQQQRMLANSSHYGGSIQQLPGAEVAIPYGTDPAASYKSAILQTTQKMRRPLPAISITSVKEIPSSMPPARSYILRGEFDARDGQGSKALLVQLVMGQPFGRFGGWRIGVYQVVVPKALLAEESSTMSAIFGSYDVNQKVVLGQTEAAMKANQANTDRVLERGRESQAKTDAILAQGRAHWDDEDRQSKAFQNYQLDQSIIRDTEQNAHGTFSNDFADALVKSNPTRFEYVPTRDFVKGLDY